MSILSNGKRTNVACLKNVALSGMLCAIMMLGLMSVPVAVASENPKSTMDSEMASQSTGEDSSAGSIGGTQRINSPSQTHLANKKSNYSAPLSATSSGASQRPEIVLLKGNETPEVVSLEELQALNVSVATGTEALPIPDHKTGGKLYVSPEDMKAPSMTDSTVEPKWLASNHQDIAYEILTTHAAKDFVDSRWWEELIIHSDDPDGGSWFHEEHYLHNPIGGACADDKVVDLTNRAITHFRNGELDPGYEDLACASHFMMDLGNPWHRDYVALYYHGQFEDWVGANWDSLLYTSCRNQPPSNYMAANPSNTLEQMAEYLNDLVYTQYSLQYHYIVYRHTHDYTNFVNSVKYCLTLTAQYTSALYAYAAPHPMLLDYSIDPYPYAEVHGVGHSERVATFVTNNIHIHLDLWNTATYGDTGTDYLYVYVYWHDGWSRTTFTNLPMTNGGYLQYDCVVSNSQYSIKKVVSLEIVWHQWTTGNWILWDGESWTTATMASDGFGVTQTQATYYDAIGKTFGYDTDPEHELAVLPVTLLRVHLEMSILETYGDGATDYLNIYAYYEDGTYSMWQFTNLPTANGGTIIYNCQVLVDTSHSVVDRFEILWHQWTWGQSSGHTWSMQLKTTIYWDTGAPGTYPS